MLDVKEKSYEKELLKKAQKPSADAMALHPFYRGKIETALKCCVRDFNDFAIWYTPGVAAPCRDIEANPEKVYEHTNKWNTVAVVTDGTRVLGLGDIGPKAALPVMEGKVLLYKYLGGVDGFPIALDTKDPDKFIETVLLLQPSFGGVNLEDIAQPKCFRILDTLRLPGGAELEGGGVGEAQDRVGAQGLVDDETAEARVGLQPGVHHLESQLRLLGRHGGVQGFEARVGQAVDHVGGGDGRRFA